MTKKVVLVPRGGLGNQLHQFVIASHLCHSRNQALTIDARHLPGKAYDSQSGVTLRPFALANLIDPKLPVRYSRSRVAHYFFRFLLEAERTVLYRLGLLPKSVVTWDNIVEKDFWSLETTRITSLLGKLNISDQMLVFAKELFTAPRNLSSSYNDIKKTILKENVVGVHIRRGDYNALSHVYGEISVRWYIDGIESVLSESQKVFVFSDTSAGFEEITLKFGEERVLVIGPEKISDPVEVLSLLTCCRSVVLSNSTLSWWSIPVGGKFEKVVYPSMAPHLIQVFDKEILHRLADAEFVGKDIY